MQKVFSALMVFSIYVVIMTTQYACSFCGRGASALFILKDNQDIVPGTSLAREMVYEDEQKLVVYHGSSCANINTSGTKKVLNVEESLVLPSYVTKATVFLNGWHLKYLGHDDHHVTALGTVIDSIVLVDNKLSWRAHGAIADHNFDDSFEWCYTYTVIGWSGSSLNLTLDDNDSYGGSSDALSGNAFEANNTGTTTALASFPTFLYNPAFISSKKVAVLPRGFGFSWSRACDDHHLQQLAYNLDHSEIFMEKKAYKKNAGEFTPEFSDNVKRVDSGFISWNTQAIYKDKDGRRDFLFGEVVTGIGGSDMEIIEPPFSILPITSHNGCIENISKNITTREYKIYRVPFSNAVPVLTGWNLGYSCTDHHVQEIGIWIDKWSYEKTEDGLGTLTYTLSSILRDDEDHNGNVSHNVGILGFKSTSTVLGGKFADLIPYSPLGNNTGNFCRLENNGKLRISIKNIGNADAIASNTRVTFNGSPVTIFTPPISAGASVDILVDPPAGCFSPDCSFNIQVDVDRQVNESGGENNNSVNGFCLG